MDASSIFESAVLKIPVPDKDRSDIKNTKGKKFSSRKGNSLDLHGKTAAEAGESLREKIGEIRRNKQISLNVITGKGTHSQGIYSPVKKVVEEFLESEAARGNLEYKDKDGHFDIWLKY